MSALDELVRALANVADKLTAATGEIDAARTLLEESETTLGTATEAR